MTGEFAWLGRDGQGDWRASGFVPRQLALELPLFYFQVLQVAIELPTACCRISARSTRRGPDACELFDHDAFDLGGGERTASGTTSGPALDRLACRCSSDTRLPPRPGERVCTIAWSAGLAAGSAP
jgi:hypothetical protein